MTNNNHTIVQYIVEPKMIKISSVFIIGKSTKQTSFGHLITKQTRFFILNIFLPPDWSLSDNVLIGSYGGWAQRLLERTCDWSNFGPSEKKQFLVSQYPGL